MCIKVGQKCNKKKERKRKNPPKKYIKIVLQLAFFFPLPNVSEINLSLFLAQGTYNVRIKKINKLVHRTNR